MSGATPKYALPYPSGFDPDNVPSWALQLATKLDNTMMGFSQGTFAARPSGGTVYGKWYYATDTVQLFQYQAADAANPAGWRLMGAMPTIQSARWYSATVQTSYPFSNDAAGNPIQVGWAFGPGSGWDGTYPYYFDGVSFTGKGWGPGPQPTVPIDAPGIYRIRGQVSFAHVAPYLGGGVYRQQQENYSVWVYRKRSALGPPVITLAYQQVSHEWFAGGSDMERNVAVDFETFASFDLSTPEQSGVEVWVASSPRASDHGIPTFVLNGVLQQVNGGRENTFLEMEHVAAI